MQKGRFAEYITRTCGGFLFKIAIYCLLTDALECCINVSRLEMAKPVKAGGAKLWVYRWRKPAMIAKPPKVYLFLNKRIVGFSFGGLGLPGSVLP